MEINEVEKISKSIEFLQINFHHSILAMEYLTGMLLKNNYSKGNKVKKIILAQEPYISHGKLKGPPSMSVIKGKETGKVRSCIFIDKEISCWLLTQFSNDDFVTIGIKTDIVFEAIICLDKIA